MKLNKIKRIGCSLVLLCGATLAADQPNIILILNDDMGYNDLGCYDAQKIKTPHIDQLAREGARFTGFYMGSCVCTASRGALLTGCYPTRIGVPGVYFPNRGEGMDPKHETIAEVLKAAGYHTKAVGKWHLGEDRPFLPTNQGFDSYYGIPYSNDMYPSKDIHYADDCLYREGMTHQKVIKLFEGEVVKGKPKEHRNQVPLMRNESCIEFPVDQSTITRRYMDESIKFISEMGKKDQPFFLYLANSMPHTPLFVSPPFKGKSEQGLYGDVVEEIDFNTGRLLDYLKETGLEKNTIVIFTSDNGPWLIKGDQGGSALPLFEGKSTRFEGGQRVPFLIRWPGQIPANSTSSEMALALDLLPTLATIAGADLPKATIDGKNILPMFLTPETAQTPHDYFFYGPHAVRHGDWKYHERQRFVVKATQRITKGPWLYNLKDDIGESVNLIQEHPEIAEQLRNALMEFNREKDAHK